MKSRKFKFAVPVPAILLLSRYALWLRKETLTPEKLTIASALHYFIDEGLQAG